MWIRRFIVRLVVFIALLFVLVIAFVYSGIYSVSARYQDNRLVAWALDETMVHSVERHAQGIKVPPLDDPAMLRRGFAHYREDCVVCHGAPGIQIGEIGQGLNPHPSEFVEAAADREANELFWITRNGIRMTGMPAWGVTQTDGEIWETVAFMRTLEFMTPAQYKALGRQVPEE